MRPSPVVAREFRPSTTPAPSRAVPVFPRTLHAYGFVFHTKADVELEPLARKAVETRRSAGAWLGVAESAGVGAPDIDMYLCRSVVSIHALELARGLPSSNVPGRTFPFAGSCCREKDRLAVLVEDGSELGGLVAHEIAHLVLHARVQHHSDAVDEGLVGAPRCRNRRR